MNKIEFKTNLNCGGCVSKVQSDLDTLLGKDQWKVNTEEPNKTLTISDSNLTEKVIEIVKSKGFLIEQK